MAAASPLSSSVPGCLFRNAGNYIAFLHYDPAQPDVTQRLVLDWQPSTTGPVYSVPALGDLDGDGALDVAIMSFSFNPNASPQWVPPMFAQAFSFKKRTLLFSTKLCASWGVSSVRTFGSPIIANVTGGSLPNVLVAYLSEVIILNANGSYYTYTSAQDCYGATPPSTSYTLATGSLGNTPAVGDLDNDGTNEIVAAGYWTYPDLYGGLFVWTGFSKGSAPWPLFRHDNVQAAVFDNMPPTAPSGISSTPAVGAGWQAMQPLTGELVGGRQRHGQRLAGLRRGVGSQCQHPARHDRERGAACNRE